VDPDELWRAVARRCIARVLLQRIAADKPDIFVCYPPYDLLREQGIGSFASRARWSSASHTRSDLFAEYTPIKASFEKIAADFARLTTFT